jgi:uncharacterized membrane protein
MADHLRDAASGHSSADEAMESALGYVLRIGVILAVLVCLAGGGLLLHQYHGASGLTLLSEQPTQLRPAQVWQQARQGSGAAIILIGLFLLLLTPVLRVLSMVFAFLWERDWLYTAISTGVLAILVIGILFGR